MDCSPWGRKESDMTEQLPFHFLLSCIGEGNGNPLRCSCLENPRDRRAWWAAFSGVAQSRTRLKRLSSSSSLEVGESSDALEAQEDRDGTVAQGLPGKGFSVMYRCIGRMLTVGDMGHPGRAYPSGIRRSQVPEDHHPKLKRHPLVRVTVKCRLGMSFCQALILGLWR